MTILVDTLAICRNDCLPTALGMLHVVRNRMEFISLYLQSMWIQKELLFNTVWQIIY